MGGKSAWGPIKLKPSPKNTSKRSCTLGMRAKIYFGNKNAESAGGQERGPGRHSSHTQ
jgi:hypothetical protein